MAAYPTTVPFKTVIRPLTATRTHVSESGVPRQQNLGAETAFQIEVSHPLCTQAQITTLQNFYDANKYAANTIPGNDGDTYDFWFQTDYAITPVSATYFNVTCRVVGNRQ